MCLVQTIHYHTHGSMFEDFFDQIDKELGPLNPSWFEELTARSSREDGGPDISKDEEEENSIKAPETSAQCSQLFSTPKTFKQHFQSPDSSNEESPYEAKTEDRPSTASYFKDKEAIFVRKRFPSLSKASESTATSSKTVKQDVIDSIETIQTEGMGRKPICSPDASLDTSSLWKQKVPSAIEDADVRSMVQSILDGAENVLSIFFSNSTSALGRVKSKERNRNKSSKDINLTLETDKEVDKETLKACKTHSDTVKTESPLENSDGMQWTPLSLPDSCLNENVSSSLALNTGEPSGDTFYRFAAENPSMSSYLNESSVVSKDAGHPQTLQQSTSHNMDEGLDMTPLSKAFAEDFTKELTSGGLVELQGQSDQLVIVSSTTTTHKEKTCQFQPEAESEQQNNLIIQQVIQGDRDIICALADVSMNSANDSTVVLPVFEVSRDSGFPTAFSDLDGTVVCSNSKDVFSGFKMASNKTISIPNETILKAKASLHEAIGDSLIDVTAQHNNKMDAVDIDTTRSSLGQSNSSKHALTTCVSKAGSSPGLLSSKSVKQSILSCSSLQKNESDYETGSKRIFTVSDVGPQKAGTLLKNLEEDSDSSKQKLEFKRAAEIQTVCSTHKAELDTSGDNADQKCPLTASQKADVTELCNLLEEADSQYDFTQFKPTKFGSQSHTTEKDWDSDIVNGIDFDDSFNCDAVKGGHQIKADPSTINNSIHTNKEIDHFSVQTVDADKLCSVSKQNQNGILPSSTTEDNSVDGLNKHFSDTNQSHCFGFKTASGKVVSVSETSLNKAKHFFEEHDEKVSYNKNNKADTEVPKPKESREQAMVCSDNTSDCMEQEYISPLQLNQDANVTLQGLEVNENLAGDAGTKPNCLDGKTDTVTVSAEALEKSKIIFKDCNENIEAAIIEETNDKLDVEIRKQANGFTTASDSKVLHKDAKAVYEDSALIHGFCDKANESVDVIMKTCQGDQVHYGEKPSLQQPPQEEGCEPKVKEFSEDLFLKSTSFNSSFGFSTASGVKLSISAEALQRAKNVLCISAEVVPCTSSSRRSKQIADKQTDNSSSGKHEGFSTAGGKRVTISVTALQRARNLFKDCEEESIAPENLQHQSCIGFSNAKGIIVSEKDSIIESEMNYDLQSGRHQNSNGSNGSMSKVKFGYGSFSEEPKGFCTAGGKNVCISASALQRAKSLFKDYEEDCLTSEALHNQSNTGFTTARGKHVTVSEKALCEVKEVVTGFVETSIRHNSPVNKVSCVPSATSGSSDEHGGFCTAGGKKVAISASALQRAMSLFQDCEEETLLSDEPVVPKTGSPRDTKDKNLKLDQLNKTNYDFSTASGKSISISNVALGQANKLFRDCDAQQVIDTDNQPLHVKSSNPNDLNVADSKSHQELPIVLDEFKEAANKTISHPLPTKVVPNKLSRPNVYSLDFKSCTETQQVYSEREAMACAKALLADDDLNEPTELMPLANIHSTKSPYVHDLQTRGTVKQNGKRKHQVGTSSTADSCQPPSKRQLLSVFVQAVGCFKCTPKSCSNGTLKGRRVFRYNGHPNATPPNGSSVDQKSKDGVQHYSSASLQTRRPVFVPPFQKSVRGQDASKASRGFITPFKKENKDNTNSNCSIQNSCEPKAQVGSCKAMENITTCSTPSTNSAAQYYGRDSLHVGSKPEAKISMDNISLKKIDSDESDTDVWQVTLQLARDMQDMRLGKKKRQTVCPLPGKLYLSKTSGVSRIGLRDAVGHKCPVRFTSEELYKHGVNYKVSQITSENAESFRFDCNDFFKRELLVSGAIQLADGGWLVPDSKGTVGKEEFCRALFDTPGVDTKLISNAWVFNHYRWIVWKQASMEKSFPELMGSLCLTPEQVLLQLKLRYDVEVDHSHRSCLRRIVERDDTPAKTLVLCICGIAKPSQNPEKLVKTDERWPDAKMESTVIWLTDGWYAIKGLLDLPLSAILNKGRLKVGDKVVVNGAELVGCQEACPPLEAPESLMLKISANSTRRARWDTKLGYYRDCRPFRLPLSSLYAAGGAVSCVDILVLRSYPTQWMEKMPSGVFIFRNDRAENREARKHSNSKQKTMELFFSNIHAQFEKEIEGKKTSQGRRRRTFSQREIEGLQDGEELYEAMESDPAVENHLSERQMEAVRKFRCCLEERIQVDLQQRVQMALNEAQEADGGCPDREVTPVWKLSIIDASDLQSNFVYTLNIWRPSADLHSLLKEGRRYRTYHLATSEGKKCSGIAQIQLTATKKTLFKDIEVTPEWLHLHFQPRVCVGFRELQNPQFSSPCGEVDIVGYIVSIDYKQGNPPVLHLMDEKFDMVSVRLSSSLEHLAIEELVKPQALLALCNVQLRQLSGPVPCLYAGEQTLFSINPKDSHLQEAMVHMKSFVQTFEDFNIEEEKVSNSFPSGSFQCPGTPGVSNPKVNGGVTPQQKSRVISPFTPVTKRTPASTSGDCESKDPKNLKRKQGLVYRSRIPFHPPPTPLKMKASPCVNKTFNPPRKSVTPKPPEKERNSSRASHPPPGEEEWVRDEELLMIDTQALTGC